MSQAFAWPADTCKSAADVLAKAKEVERKRHTIFAEAPHKPIKIVKRPKPPKPPVSEPENDIVPILVFPTLTSSIQAHFQQVAEFPPEVIQAQKLHHFPSIHKIQKIVCSVANISEVDFLSARKDQKSVIPRQISMMLCRMLTMRSFPEIGRRHGDRDHTTVIHAMKKFQPVANELKQHIGHTGLTKLVLLAFEIYQRLQPPTFDIYSPRVLKRFLASPLTNGMFASCNCFKCADGASSSVFVSFA